MTEYNSSNIHVYTVETDFQNLKTTQFVNQSTFTNHQAEFSCLSNETNTHSIKTDSVRYEQEDVHPALSNCSNQETESTRNEQGDVFLPSTERPNLETDSTGEERQDVDPALSECPYLETDSDRYEHVNGFHTLSECSYQNKDSNLERVSSNPSLSECSNQNKDSNLERVSSNPSLSERICSWRTFIVLLLHVACALNSMNIVNIAMAVVCMTGPVHADSNQTIATDWNHSTISGVISTDNLILPKYEFSWSSEMRGLIISGHLMLAVVVGPLVSLMAGYLGNKTTLTLLNGTMLLLSCLSPPAARVSVYLLLAARLLSGLTLNASIPVSGDMLAWWLPVSERLTSLTIVQSGFATGASLGTFLSGYLCQLPWDNGWPFIFYSQGAITAVWLVLWVSLSSRKPEDHRLISAKEKSYILSHRVGMNPGTASSKDNIPYRTILTSPGVAAYMIGTSGYVWALVIVFTCLPLYQTSILKCSVPESGLLTAVVSLLRLPALLLWAVLGNWLTSGKSVSVNRVRKIQCGLSQGLSAAFFLLTSFCDQDQKWLAIVCVTLAVMTGVFGATLMGIVPLDMAPRYAGFISGLGSSAAILVSATGPLIVSAITTQGSFQEWRVVWIVLAAGTLVCGMVFVVWGSASLQSWAVVRPDLVVYSVQSVSPKVQSVNKHVQSVNQNVQ